METPPADPKHRESALDITFLESDAEVSPVTFGQSRDGDG
jgi:hypothetical protein